MNVFNTSPYSAGIIPGWINYPSRSLTFIVKATYDLKANAVVADAEEQDILQGDMLLNEEKLQDVVLTYETDMAFYKPYADLLCHANCHSKEPVAECEVSFQVGNLKKTLLVTGERAWENSKDFVGPTPFTTMPIDLHHAFGGKGFKSNPYGKGKDVTESDHGNVHYLPNIESLNDRITRRNQKIQPVGFGPVPRNWGERSQLVGTYHKSWIKERWPAPFADFNYQFYNCAPEDMQVKGYLRGDELLQFNHMHPEYQQLKTVLPGLRVRCFILQKDVSDVELEHSLSVENDLEFGEITMNLDTLYADVTKEKLYLTWRGVLIMPDESTDHIQEVFIIREPLDEQSKTLQDYFQDLQQAKKDEEAEWVDLDDDDEQVTDDLSEDEKNAAEIENVNKIINESWKELDAHLAKMLDNFGPDGISDSPKIQSLIDAREKGEFPKLLPEEQQQMDAIIAAYGLADEEELTRALVVKRLNEKKSFENFEFTNLDLSNLDFSYIDLSQSVFTNVNLKGTNFSHANLDHVIFVDTDLSGLNFSESCMTNVDCTNAKLVKANFYGADLSEAAFDKAKLCGANMTNVQAIYADFDKANLIEAKLDNSCFENSDFSEAILEFVSAKNANFSNATLEGAVLRNADFTGSLMNELRASEAADFSYANLTSIQAPDSVWDGAILTQTNFTNANLNSAQFAESHCDEVDFSFAKLKFINFHHASINKTDFKHCDMFDASFHEAKLTRVNFYDVNLYGSDFFGAEMIDTVFVEANMKSSNFELFHGD